MYQLTSIFEGILLCVNKTWQLRMCAFIQQAKLEKEKAKKMKVKAERDARKEKDKQKWRDRKTAWKLKRKAEKEQEKRKAAEAEAKKAQAEKLLRDRARSLTGGEDSDDDDDSDGDRCSSLLCLFLLLFLACVFVLGVSDTLPHAHDRIPNFVIIFTLSPKRTYFIVSDFFCFPVWTHCTWQRRFVSLRAVRRSGQSCERRRGDGKSSRGRFHWRHLHRVRVWPPQGNENIFLAFAAMDVVVFSSALIKTNIFFFVVKCLPSCQSLALMFRSIVSILCVGGLLGLRRPVREANVVSKA